MAEWKCRNASITEHEEAVPVPAFYYSINPVFQSACFPIGPKSNIQASRSLIDSACAIGKSFACTFGITEVIELFIAKVEAKWSSATHVCHTHPDVFISEQISATLFVFMFPFSVPCILFATWTHPCETGDDIQSSNFGFQFRSYLTFPMCD